MSAPHGHSLLIGLWFRQYLLHFAISTILQSKHNNDDITVNVQMSHGSSSRSLKKNRIIKAAHQIKNEPCWKCLQYPDDDSLLSQRPPSWKSPKLNLESLQPNMLQHFQRLTLDLAADSESCSWQWKKRDCIDFAPDTAIRSDVFVFLGITTSHICTTGRVSTRGRTLTQNREKKRNLEEWFFSPHTIKQNKIQIWWTLAPSWLNAHHGKQCVKINMISFNHSTDEKQIVTPHYAPPPLQREGGRETRSAWQAEPQRRCHNVTSSTAIAPGCLSA